MDIEQKRRAAIEWLGTRWCLHPERRIKKGSYKEPPIQKVDVAATFSRVLRRLAQV